MLKKVRVYSRALQKAEHACKRSAVSSDRLHIFVISSEHMLKVVERRLAGKQ